MANHIGPVKPLPPKTPEGSVRNKPSRCGGRWVHFATVPDLRARGCCDSSPNRHATKHSHHTKHPIVASFEPDERWAWCFIDEDAVDLPREVLKYLR